MQERILQRVAAVCLFQQRTVIFVAQRGHLRAQVSALCYENHCALLEETNGSDALEDAFLHVIARKDISRKEVE